MTGFMFNIDSGYLEALCRGFKCGILKQADYLNLVQCETLEGKNFSSILYEFYLKMHIILLKIGNKRNYITRNKVRNKLRKCSY